jgi:DNA-binding HxlR family transcriptional regulator
MSSNGDQSVFNCECQSHRVLELITRKWTALVIAILAEGPYRYNALQSRIHGISPKVLTQTLRALERDGLIERAHHHEAPPRVEYSLTALGRSLTNILVPVCRWAEQHLHEVEAHRRQSTARTIKT